MSNRRKREDTEKMDPVVQEKLVDATRPLATTPDGAEVLPSVIVDLEDEEDPALVAVPPPPYNPGVTDPKLNPYKKRATTPTIPNQEKIDMTDTPKFNPLTQPPTHIGCGGDPPPPTRDLTKAAELMPVIEPAPKKDPSWVSFATLLAVLAALVLLLWDRCDGDSSANDNGDLAKAITADGDKTRAKLGPDGDLAKAIANLQLLLVGDINDPNGDKGALDRIYGAILKTAEGVGHNARLLKGLGKKLDDHELASQARHNEVKGLLAALNGKYGDISGNLIKLRERERTPVSVRVIVPRTKRVVVEK